MNFLFSFVIFQGFVVQETTSQTVEDFVFDALTKTRLIEARTTANYHRCGRTDRGELFIFLNVMKMLMVTSFCKI